VRTRQWRYSPSIHACTLPSPQALGRHGARAGMGDQLGDHRVVVQGDLAARGDTAVDPHANDCRLGVVDDHAARRGEVALRRLGVDARLNRPAAARDRLLGERQRFAQGAAQLALDQIEPGGEFGHRVLDLQPRVHLEEPGLVAACLHHELDRADRVVADPPPSASAAL
jgi:hypothetical protein